MNNKKGYTLIELIITLAVIGIMIVPIFNSFTESHKINVLSKRRIVASYLAQTKMEDIKSFTVDEIISNLLSNDDAIKIPGNTEEFTVIERKNDLDYSITTTIDNVTDDLIAIESAESPFEESNAEITLDISADMISTLQGLLMLTSKTIIIRVSENSVEVDGLGSVNYTLDGDLNLNIHSDNTLDSWDVSLVNTLTDTTLNVRIVDDSNNMVSVHPSTDELSSSDIWISNSMFSNYDDIESKQWYNVIITVSQDDTTYEILESTVGK